jgi:hypothetical protein
MCRVRSILFLLAVLASACGSSDLPGSDASQTPAVDAGVTMVPDGAAAPDAGPDGAAASGEAGVEAGLDAGADAGSEAGVPALAVDRSEVDFGPVPVGVQATPLTVALSNNGGASTGPLAIEVYGMGFALSTTTCPDAGLEAGASCRLTLTFLSNYVGLKQGTMTISSPYAVVSVSLRGTGATPDLHVSTTRIEFPATAIGATSGGEQVTIKNLGGAPATNLVVQLGDSVNFTLATDCSSTLAGQAACQATIAFAPRSRGPRTSALSVIGGTQSLPVSLAGNGLALANLVVQPTAPAVSATVNTTSTPIHFIVGNSGDIASGVPMASIAGTDQNQFTISSNGCVTPIAPLTTCSLDVVFRPTSAGTKAARLEVVATPGRQVTSMITGTAVP